MNHELGDLFRDADPSGRGMWFVTCSCGWQSAYYQQRRKALNDWAQHVASESEELVKP